MEEFSHTVLHGENFKKKIQNLALNASSQNKAPAKAVPVTPRSKVTPLYDPSRIYKSPVVLRGPLVAQPQPQQAKAAHVLAVRKRPNSAQRDGSYLEQQRLKRAAAEMERLKRRHLEFIEKQKVKHNMLHLKQRTQKTYLNKFTA